MQPILVPGKGMSIMFTICKNYQILILGYDLESSGALPQIAQILKKLFIA